MSSQSLSTTNLKTGPGLGSTMLGSTLGSKNSTTQSQAAANVLHISYNDPNYWETQLVRSKFTADLKEVKTLDHQPTLLKMDESPGMKRPYYNWFLQSESNPKSPGPESTYKGPWYVKPEMSKDIKPLSPQFVPGENKGSNFELGKHPGAHLKNRLPQRFYTPVLDGPNDIESEFYNVCLDKQSGCWKGAKCDRTVKYYIERDSEDLESGVTFSPSNAGCSRKESSYSTNTILNSKQLDYSKNGNYGKGYPNSQSAYSNVNGSGFLASMNRTTSDMKEAEMLAEVNRLKFQREQKAKEEALIAKSKNKKKKKGVNVTDGGEENEDIGGNDDEDHLTEEQKNTEPPVIGEDGNVDAVDADGNPINIGTKNSPKGGPSKFELLNTFNDQDRIVQWRESINEIFDNLYEMETERATTEKSQKIRAVQESIIQKRMEQASANQDILDRRPLWTHPSPAPGPGHQHPIVSSPSESGGVVNSQLFGIFTDNGKTLPPHFGVKEHNGNPKGELWRNINRASGQGGQTGNDAEIPRCKRWKDLSDEEKVYRRRLWKEYKRAVRENSDDMMRNTIGYLRRERIEKAKNKEYSAWLHNSAGEVEKNTFYYMCGGKLGKDQNM